MTRNGTVLPANPGARKVTVALATDWSGIGLVACTASTPMSGGSLVRPSGTV